MRKFTILAGVVTVLASLFANTFASFFWTHQPKTPKCM